MKLWEPGIVADMLIEVDLRERIAARVRERSKPPVYPAADQDLIDCGVNLSTRPVATVAGAPLSGKQREAVARARFREAQRLARGRS